jgi:hypothetical protein
MTKPTIRIYETDGTLIDREMNEDEFAQYEKDQATELVLKAEAQAKVEAKAAAQAKLATLGLTVEDLTALGL